jgi:hypothetical protein
MYRLVFLLVIVSLGAAVNAAPHRVLLQNQPACKDPDTGNWIPNGSSVNCKQGSGTRKCNWGNWEGSCTAAGACWEADGGNWIPHGSVVNCKQGSGSRKCDWGNWQGFCPAAGACWDAENGNWVPHGSNANCKGSSVSRRCDWGNWQGTCPAPGACRDPDTGTWTTHGSSINCKQTSEIGARTCNWGNWVSTCVASGCNYKDPATGKYLADGDKTGCGQGWSGTIECKGSQVIANCQKVTCFDVHSGKEVDNNSMWSCTKGGTRLCSNGSWRVTNGECMGTELTDKNGNAVILVGSAPPKL